MRPPLLRPRGKLGPVFGPFYLIFYSGGCASAVVRTDRQFAFRLRTVRLLLVNSPPSQLMFGFDMGWVRLGWPRLVYLSLPQLKYGRLW